MAARACTLVRKPQSSRRRPLVKIRWLVAAVVAFFLLPEIGQAASLDLSSADARRIGKKIWQNECDGTIAGLTSWNKGENFASLGIGHFIWYPKGVRGPFEESFPDLIMFAAKRGAKLPDLLLGPPTQRDCPWATRAKFIAAQGSTPLKQLRTFLADTIDLQAQFLVQRLQNALSKILAEAPAAERTLLQQRFYRVASTSQGCYALVDYVNFKGEGVLHTERYNEEGWGLLQVLEAMRDEHGSAAREFSRAAATVLTRRVRNAPPARHEARWLPGWLNRVATYAKG